MFVALNQQHVNRLTASLCNKFGQKTPKTAKGLRTMAHNIVHGDKNMKKNKVIHINCHLENTMNLLPSNTTRVI